TNRNRQQATGNRQFRIRHCPLPVAGCLLPVARSDQYAVLHPFASAKAFTPAFPIPQLNAALLPPPFTAPPTPPAYPFPYQLSTIWLYGTPVRPLTGNSPTTTGLPIRPSSVAEALYGHCWLTQS